MAKLTKAELESLAKAYVDSTKVASDTFSPTIDDFTKTMAKIGEMVTIYLPQVDKLPELDGNNLPYGQIIEEFMVDDFLPTDYEYVDGDGVKTSRRPTFEDASYSYPLTDKLFELGIPYSQYQRVSTDSAAYGSLVSSSLASLDSSYNAWNYAAKRQLLGEMGKRAIAAGLTESVGDPSAWDDQAGQDFIQKVLNQVEDAKDLNEHNLANHACAGAPSLKLYVSHKVMPAVKVKTLAGAFHKDELAIPAEIKTILDFGDQDNIVAILVDERAVKLKDCINETESIAANFVVSTKRHVRQTGYISKFGFVHVFTKE